MPKIGGRRRKTRTHEEINDELSADIPRSLILKRGRVGKMVTKLVKELRTTMYPYTAINLKESKANTIKDYLSIKDVYGLSHMMMLTNTEKASYLRLAKMPRGPTVTFKIEKYCLSSDIFEYLSSLEDNKRRVFKPLTKSFNHVPLVIMNGFNNPYIPLEQKESVNIAAMLIQSFFPPINLNEIQLKRCKRVVLFNLKLETPSGMKDFDEDEYDDEEKRKIYENSKPIIEFRHYDIDIEKFSVKKTISNILNSKKTDLSKFQSISDYILKQSGFTSGSDNDDPNLGVVEVIKDEEMKTEEEKEEETKKDESKQSDKKEENNDNRVKVKLVELGPRINMSIKKIEEGFLKGNVVYHSVIKKTKKEIRDIMEKIKLKNKLKKQRKMEQEKNIEVKEQKEEEKLTEEEREELRMKRQKEEEFLKRKRKRELKQQKEDESQTTMTKLEMKQFQKLKKGKK